MREIERIVCPKKYKLCLIFRALTNKNVPTFPEKKFPLTAKYSTFRHIE